MLAASLPLAAVGGALFYIGDDPNKYDVLFENASNTAVPVATTTTTNAE